MAHLFLQYRKTIFISLLVLILSTIPGNSLHKVPIIEIPNLDKLIHFIMYFSLATSLLLDVYKVRSFVSFRVVWFTIFYSFLYGILMELLQKYFVENRTSDILDVLANTVGLLFAIFFFLKIKKYQKWITKISSFF